jgi:hypothetical protein
VHRLLRRVDRFIGIEQIVVGFDGKTLIHVKGPRPT